MILPLHEYVPPFCSFSDSVRRNILENQILVGSEFVTIDWAIEGVSCTIEPIWSCPVAIILLEAKGVVMRAIAVI